jgi:hypothetical protein
VVLAAAIGLPSSDGWDYLIVAAIGVLVGASEILNLYRDAALRALANLPAVAYCFVNAAAAVIALAVTRAAGWNFGASASGDSLRWLQIGVSGLGAMALFRSSLFVANLGGSHVNVGPSGVLQIFLDSANRSVDRIRGRARIRRMVKLMQGVDFDAAYAAVPPLCLASMQSLSEPAQRALDEQLKALSADPLTPPWAKSVTLGLTLYTMVGFDVVKGAVDALKTNG